MGFRSRPDEKYREERSLSPTNQTVSAFREPLPEGCPPAVAEELGHDLTVFRIVRTAAPSLDDFRSQREEKPNGSFRVSECVARGVSIFTDEKDAKNALLLPRLAGRRLARLKIGAGSGVVHDTPSGAFPSHRTWWPFADYDILAHVEEVAA
jgi:hypothetical protein